MQVSPRILSLSTFHPGIPGDDFLNLQVLHQFFCNTQIKWEFRLYKKKSGGVLVIVCHMATLLDEGLNYTVMVTLLHTVIRIMLKNKNPRLKEVGGKKKVESKHRSLQRMEMTT